MKQKATNIIDADVMSSLQGVMPSAIATCSADGVPNISCISQVYYVDATHVAISNQFFNKTIRNIGENPMICAIITCPESYIMRKLMLRFVESQTSGEVFDKMKLQLEIIASMQKKSDVFCLRAAAVCELISIETLQ